MTEYWIDPNKCYVCDSEQVGYVDILGFPWCRPCLDEADGYAAEQQTNRENLGGI